MSALKARYKYCAVPKCTNTTISTPNKIFISVPRNPKLCYKWCKLMNRKQNLSPKNSNFCCEDHFDLQNDVENYTRYKMMGGKIYLRPGVFPHKFGCQKEKSNTVDRPGAEKRRRIEYYEKLLNPDVQASVASQPMEFIGCGRNYSEDQATDYMDDHNPINIPEVLPVRELHKTENKGTQVTMKKPMRSKGTSTENFTPTMQALKKDENNGETENNTSISTESESDNSCSVSSNSSDTSMNDFTCNNEDHANENTKVTLVNLRRYPKLFLGLPEDSLFCINRLSEVTKLPEIHIMITLRKIRLHESYSILAVYFGLNRSTIGKIFKNAVPLMASCLNELIFFPKPQDIFMNLPIAFRKRFSRVQCIIDCFEVEIVKSSKPSEQALTWSEYKSCNTVKYLISITPDGLINFVSKGYGGRTSDTVIFEDCGIVSKIQSGAILADRGFKNIAHLLERQGCTLLRPPTVCAKSKSSKEEVTATKRISAVRVHVERSIGRLRDFKMISPHARVNIQHIKLLDYVVIIACGVVNLQSPLIKI